MSKSLGKRLRRAMELNTPITILRRGLGKETDGLDGFVMSIGGGWFVLAALSQVVYLDGWELLRIRDVTDALEGPSKSLVYVERTVRSLGGLAELPRDLELMPTASLKEALVEILASVEIVGVWDERRHPGAVNIGNYVGTNGRQFGLRQISSDGTWKKQPELFKLSKVSRVTVGGRYQDALSLFGDPMPPID